LKLDGVNAPLKKAINASSGQSGATQDAVATEARPMEGLVPFVTVSLTLFRIAREVASVSGQIHQSTYQL